MIGQASMLTRKIIPFAALLTAVMFSQQAIAGYFYLGPTVLYEDITSDNSTVRGVKPRIAAGYGTCFGLTRLAAEVFAVPGIYAIDDNHSNGAPSIKPSQEYGASFLPGIQFNDSAALYARIGVISSHFSGPDTRKTGGQIGAGLQGKISKNWDARLEYIYTIYPTISGMGTPHANDVGFGVIRKFYW